MSMFGINDRSQGRKSVTFYIAKNIKGFNVTPVLPYVISESREFISTNSDLPKDAQCQTYMYLLFFVKKFFTCILI